MDTNRRNGQDVLGQLVNQVGVALSRMYSQYIKIITLIYGMLLDGKALEYANSENKIISINFQYILKEN